MRPIPGFDGYFADSNGCIYSAWRAPGVRSTPKRMTLFLSRRGYLRVGVRSGSRRFTMSVHHLVAMAFDRDRRGDEQMRHLDGNKLNNCPANLRWGSAIENAMDKRSHGTMCRGERHGKSRLTATAVATIRARYNRAATRTGALTLARELGVSRSTVARVALGRGWAHV